MKSFRLFGNYFDFRNQNGIGVYSSDGCINVFRTSSTYAILSSHLHLTDFPAIVY